MSQYSQSHKAQIVRATIHTARLIKSEIVSCIIHSTRRDARCENERESERICLYVCVCVVVQPSTPKIDLVENNMLVYDTQRRKTR